MAPFNGNISNCSENGVRIGKKRLSDFFLSDRQITDDSTINEVFIPNKVRRMSFDRVSVTSLDCSYDSSLDETCKYAGFFRCLDRNKDSNKKPEKENSKELLSCKVCKASFPLNQNKLDVFKKHAIQHSDVDNLRCLVCRDFKCRKESTMKNHLRDVHNQFPTRSTKNALYSRELNDFDQSKVNETTVRCFPGLSSILTAPEESSSLATCQMCQSTVRNGISSLEAHVRTHFQVTGKISCRLCSFEGDREAIDDHVLKQHKSTTDVYKRLPVQDAKIRTYWFNRCFPTMMN